MQASSMFNGSGSAELAKRLLDRACLSNSFVMLARLSTLMRLIMVTAPELYRPFCSRKFDPPYELRGKIY
jgi:hypothetical protein